MNILRRWIWSLLGYSCCLPVHHHELKGILDDYYKRTNENMLRQNADQRAQLFEFFKQQEAQKTGPLEVRIVE